MHSDDDTIRLCGIFLFIHLYFSACYIGVVSTHLECVQNTGIVISDGDRTYRGVERLTVDARSMQDVNTLPIPATLPVHTFRFTDNHSSSFVLLLLPQLLRCLCNVCVCSSRCTGLCLAVAFLTKFLLFRPNSLQDGSWLDLEKP